MNVLDFIIKVVNQFTPRFHLKVKQKRAQAIFKVFRHVLIWGISLGIFFGGIFIIVWMLSVILGRVPIF